jgi:hypothetical protein
MKRMPTLLIFTFAMFVLVCGVGVAEYSVRVPDEIPQIVFFGIPFLGVAIALFSAYRAFSLGGASAGGWRRIKPYLGAALLLTMLPMMLMNSRYRGEYDPLTGRVAPDGSPVHSISWSREGGHYVERLNGQFSTEITESQYHEIMGKHQRTLVGVVVVFASLGFWVSAALLAFERRGPQNAS